MGRGRVKWIDALKLFAIFLVLWGHSLQYFLSSDYAANPVFRVIYSFHMPLFMMLSGMWAGKLLERGLPEVVVAKARQLLLPVAAFGILWGLIKVEEAPLRIVEFWTNALWFLKSAFLCAVIFRIAALPHRYRGVWLLLSVVAVLPVEYCDLWQMYPCFVAGWLLGRNFDAVKARSGRIIAVSGAAFVGMLLWFGPEFFAVGGPGSYGAGYVTDGLAEVLFKAYYKMVIGMFGGLFFILLFEWLSRRVPASPAGNALCRAGELTLGIYVVQWFVVEWFLASRLNFDAMSPWAFDLVVAPLLSALVLAGCVAAIRVLHRLPHASLLLPGSGGR